MALKKNRLEAPTSQFVNDEFSEALNAAAANCATPEQIEMLRVNPRQFLDLELAEAFNAAAASMATPQQIEMLRAHEWTVFDLKTNRIRSLSFDDLKALGAWSKVVNAPWFLFENFEGLKPQEQPRDYQAEKRSRQIGRANRVLALKSAREAALDSPETSAWASDLMFLSRYFVTTALPYSKTTERTMTRKARYGDGTRVTLTIAASVDGIDLPYGADRTLLHWLLDQVARNIQKAKAAMQTAKTPEEQERARALTSKVHLVPWKHSSAYLRDMGISDTGKNRQDLRERFKRLAGLSLAFHYQGPRMEEVGTEGLLRVRMPSKQEEDSLARGEQLLDPEEVFGVHFSRDVAVRLVGNAVPAPREVLRLTRRQAQTQDIWLYLAFRSFSAKQASLIPWRELREAFWHADSNPRRLRATFKAAISEMQKIWPELKAEAKLDGLWIAPPKNGKQLLVQGEGLKSLD